MKQWKSKCNVSSMERETGVEAKAWRRVFLLSDFWSLSRLFIYLFIYFSFFLDLLGRLLTKRHVHVFFLKFLFLLFCLFVFVFVFVPASSPYLLNTWRLRQNKNLWPSPFLSFHAVSFYHIGQGFARNWKWKMRLKRMSGVQKRQLRFLSIVIIVAILR